MKILPICLTLVGCVGDAPTLEPEAAMQTEQRRIDETQHLVVRVKVSPNQSLGIYQPHAGQLLMSQVGRNGLVPLELPDDPIAAFRQLAPEHDVPQVLVDAVAGKSIALSEAVTVDVAPKLATFVFPQAAFQCWVKNQYACVYHQRAVDHNPHGYDYLNQSFNAVWAVENGWVHTTIHLNYSPSYGDTYDYDTYDGWWRTFQVTGTFQVSFGAGSATTWAPDGSRGYDSYFHYSSAGWQ